MKIVFVTIAYPPLGGGLTAHVKGIVGLAEKLGYQTVVITVDPNPNRTIDGELDSNVIRLPVLKWFKDSPIINPYRLYRTLRMINTDIIHVVYPFPIGLDVACIYAHLNHKKLVCTYIDDIILKFPYSLIVKVYEYTIWKICKTMIESISVSTREYGDNAVGLIDWKSRFYEIPPPVFDNEFNLTLDKKFGAKARLKLNDFTKIVLFVGWLGKRTNYKRLDLLLKAWSEYKKQNKQHKTVLLVVGDGELKSYYENMAKELGLAANDVIFKGFVSTEVLVDCYLASDIFILPSEDNNEAFGIVVIESMLYGNFVISTDIAGIRGAVMNGEGCHVSLISPKTWKPIFNELIIWIGRDLSEYAIENHNFAKKYYTRDVVKEQLLRMYVD